MGYFNLSNPEPEGRFQQFYYASLRSIETGNSSSRIISSSSIFLIPALWLMRILLRQITVFLGNMKQADEMNIFIALNKHILSCPIKMRGDLIMT